MFYISRAIAFAACLAAAVFFHWGFGVGGLFAAVFFIPRSSVKFPRAPAERKESK